ncbi:MAG: transporter substrate-binding domain-containing protein [Sarcina sp.]
MKKGIVKKLMALTMATSLCMGMFACGGGETKADAGSDKPAAEKTLLDQIKAEGKIVLGTSADYPPYEFRAEVNGKNEIVGFDVEIAKEVAKDLGVELVIQDMKFDTLVAALQSGTIDFIVSGMNPTPERQQAVDFSDIYYKAEHGIVIKKENKDKLKTKDDFKGLVVGAQKGSIQETLAQEQMEGVTFRGLGKVPDLMLEMLGGTMDGAVMEIPVAKANVNANPELYVIENPGFKLDETEKGSAIAVPKNSPELLEQINKTVARLVSEGKIESFIVDANTLMEKEQAK